MVKFGLSQEEDMPSSLGDNSSKRKLSAFEADEVDHWLTTTLKPENRTTVHWAIDGYESHDGEIIESSLFRDVNLGHAWKLLVYPSTVLDGIEYFGAEVNLMSFSDDAAGTDEERERSLKVKLTITVLDAEGASLKELSGSDFLKVGEAIGWAKFAPANDIEDRALRSGKLRLVARLRTENDSKRRGRLSSHNIINSEPQRSEASPNSEPLAKKQRSEESNPTDDQSKAQEPLNVGLGPYDVEIATSTGRRFLVHKSILTQKCSYLSGLIDQQTRNLAVTIRGFSDAAIIIMLHYFYDVEYIEKYLLHGGTSLLQLSDEYGVTGLKDMVEGALIAALNTENAGDYFIAGLRCNAPKLKGKAMYFMKWNHAAVIQTEGYKRALKYQGNLSDELWPHGVYGDSNGVAFA